MNKFKHGPKKGAAKKWSERLRKLGQQKPPQSLMDKLNERPMTNDDDSQNETKVRFKKATLYVAFYKWISLLKTTQSGIF